MMHDALPQNLASSNNKCVSSYTLRARNGGVTNQSSLSEIATRLQLGIWMKLRPHLQTQLLGGSLSNLKWPLVEFDFSLAMGLRASASKWLLAEGHP